MATDVNQCNLSLGVVTSTEPKILTGSFSSVVAQGPMNPQSWAIRHYRRIERA
jgi:hypothetical protein